MKIRPNTTVFGLLFFIRCTNNTLTKIQWEIYKFLVYISGCRYACSIAEKFCQPILKITMFYQGVTALRYIILLRTEHFLRYTSFTAALTHCQYFLIILDNETCMQHSSPNITISIFFTIDIVQIFTHNVKDISLKKKRSWLLSLLNVATEKEITDITLCLLRKHTTFVSKTSYYLK